MAWVRSRLIVFPILTVAAFVLAVVVLFVIERQVEAAMERSKIACAGMRRA